MNQAATLTPTNTAYQLEVQNADGGLACYIPAGNCAGDYDHTLMNYCRGLVRRGFVIDYLNDDCTDAHAVKPATDSDPAVSLVLRVINSGSAVSSW